MSKIPARGFSIRSSRCATIGVAAIEEEDMAIADVVNGKATEPLTVRALVGDGTRRPARCSSSPSATGAQLVDLKFTDLPGTWQHMGMALASLDEDALQRGDRLRRLVDPRVPGDLRVGHAADARPVDRDPGSVLRGADDLARVHGARPDHARALLARPALRGDEGRGSTCARAGSPTSATSGPRRSSTSSTTSRSTSRRTPRSTRSTRRRATGRPARGSSAAARDWPRSATRTARRRATSRRRRTTR